MDAVVFEARGEQYCNSVQAISDTFRELCLVMSKSDPCKSRFMSRYPDEFPFWSLTFGMGEGKRVIYQKRSKKIERESKPNSKLK